jgi:hypothetical protein
MRRTLLGVLLSLAVSLGLVQVVKVEPVKASWSGWAHRLPPYNYVAQGITCNFDEPVYAEYFTGTATGQQYQVQLLIPGNPPVVVAEGNAYEIQLSRVTTSGSGVTSTLTVPSPSSKAGPIKSAGRWPVVRTA